MGKPKTGKAKTGKAKTTAKAKAPKAEKPTAATLSDQERQKLLFKHKRILKPLLAYKKEANDDVREAYEIAKKEGITRKQIELAIALENAEGVEAMKTDLAWMADVARWSGVAKQLDLFGAKDDTTKSERLFEDGRIAALNDQPAKPPDHLAQKDAQVWLDGHAAGRTSLNETRASGFKPLSETVDKIVPTAPPVPPVNGGAEQQPGVH